MTLPAPGQEPSRSATGQGRAVDSPATNPYNRRVLLSIYEALHQNQRLRYGRLDITYAHGTAEVKGTVATEALHDEMMRTIQNVPGVERIRDLVVVRNAQPIKRIESAARGDSAAPSQTSLIQPVQAIEPSPPTSAPPSFPAPSVVPGGPPMNSPMAAAPAFGGSMAAAPVPGAPVPGAPAPCAPTMGGTVPGGTVPGGTVPGGTVPGGPMMGGPMMGAPGGPGEPMPISQVPPPSGYDLNPPKMPPYAWPTYAPYNNNSRVAYPELYPYQSWPFIGPIHPFPKVPLSWRAVKLEWQDGYWWYSTHSNSHDWWRLRFW
jgi:hypothetical protein